MKMKITTEMKEMFTKVRTPSIATASRDGKPNVVPIAFTKVISDNEILLMDNYMNKTRANIEANPEVAISIWDFDLRTGYQFKGKARIQTAGTVFDEGIQWVKNRRPQIAPRAAIIVTVDEIYLLGSGPDAGKRIA
jgi:predicted pyridoxine 5'-phosphate oxidase superfamily flavin-nucleotide-binding protein